MESAIFFQRAFAAASMALFAMGCAHRGGTGAEYGLETTTTRQRPVGIVTNGNGRVFVDFGKDAFGWLELVPPPGFTGGTYQVVVSESRHADMTCDSWAGGTIRSAGWPFGRIGKDESVHRVPFRADEANTDFTLDPPPVRLRESVGVVLPFRYAEFYETPFPITAESVRRVMVHYPIDMGESSFSCSDERLNAVYEFCKYSILATSFAGLYVDGDRERVPYEADAYINQLGNYAISSDGRLARASWEYLLRHPTWPTEWKQHEIMMVWTDWMWTGETEPVARAYDRLKDVCLLRDRLRPDGLLASPPQVLVGPGLHCDLIDWPPRDRDGYVFCPASAVVNAFYFRTLEMMADLAAAIGRGEESTELRTRADEVRATYLRVFFDAAQGLCRDGEGTDHHGFHANVLALAFGLIPADRREKTLAWLQARGMVGSVYFAQYLLDALYACGCPDAARALMTATDDRSWLGMIQQGSTITLEAWNMNDKPNLDWNHAWATAPLNVIARFVLGVTPLEPGFAKISVKPQVGGLKSVKGVVPTARGPVTVEISGNRLTVSTPAPARIVWNGRTDEVQSGRHEFD